MPQGHKAVAHLTIEIIGCGKLSTTAITDWDKAVKGFIYRQQMASQKYWAERLKLFFSIGKVLNQDDSEYVDVK